MSTLRIDRPEAESRLCLGYAVAYIFAALPTARLILAFSAPLLGATSLTDQVWS